MLMKKIIFKDENITIYENAGGEGFHLGFKEGIFHTLFEAICYASSVFDMTSLQKDNKAEGESHRERLSEKTLLTEGSDSLNSMET